MTYFIENFIKGAASISLLPQQALNQISVLDRLYDRAQRDGNSIEKTIKKHFFEIMLGQAINFVLVIGMLAITVYMVYSKMPDIYSFIAALMSQIFLYAPKVWLYFKE